MNANEIADLMEQVADRLLFVHRMKGSIVSGARLYDILTSLSTVLNFLRFTLPKMADSIEEIRADIKDVANGCLGGESLPRAEMRPGGLMLPRCAKRLRDIATMVRQGTKTNGKREPPENPPPVGKRWSKPMTKANIVTALHIDSVHKLNTMARANVYEVVQVGKNRQAWRIRIDNIDLDDKTQKRLT